MHPLLNAGFRPLFLAAAGWSALSLAVWLSVLAGDVDLPSRFDPLTWHIHEMLFGFIMAAVGGFLLTAIPNWTNRAPVAGTDTTARPPIRYSSVFERSFPYWRHSVRAVCSCD